MILAYFGGYTAKELFFVVFYKIGVLSAFQIFKNDTLPFVIPHGFCAGYTPFFWLFFCRERALSLDLFFFFVTISALPSDSKLKCCLLGLKAV